VPGFEGPGFREVGAVGGPAVVGRVPRPDERLLTLTRQEMTADSGLRREPSNRQIGQEMFLAEKTEMNMVSTILRKLGMARRTQAAVLITGSLHHREPPPTAPTRPDGSRI
jgi:hypothetical protein